MDCKPCLDCSSKRSLDCRKYFGSDHLKFKRFKKFRCKNERIQFLAKPKYYTPKYIEDTHEPIKRTIEIARDTNLSTRIRMLSVPKVRKLVASYEDYKNIVDREKLSNINKLIQNSLMTMYSRLANVHLINKKSCRKWTKTDWQKHCEWLRKRACPKKLPAPKKEKRKIIPVKEMETLSYRLSQPRHLRQKYRKLYGYQPAVKDSCKQYNPTKRIIQLAEPKKVPEREDEYEDLEGTESFYASPNALTYNATERIMKLARPKPIPMPYMVKNPPECTPFGVVKRALKASLSERTIELSKPKLKDDDDDEPKPLVSPKALKAKPTRRILELAKPKVFP